MATAKEKGAGKSMFLKEYLVNHPGAGKEAVDAAWRAAGHEGTISQSLIGKIRGELEPTSRRMARAKSRARIETGQRPSTGAKSDILGAGRTGKREDQSDVPTGLEQTAALKAGGDRTDVLIRLEGALDGLLHEIKLVGGLPEFEVALRRARRVLIRSHR